VAKIALEREAFAQAVSMNYDEKGKDRLFCSILFYKVTILLKTVILQRKRALH